VTNKDLYGIVSNCDPNDNYDNLYLNDNIKFSDSILAYSLHCTNIK